MSRNNCAIGKDVVPASFKGVGFWCTDANIEGGRRGAEGEFPFGEDPAYADLGRKIRVFNLTAVFREDDHVGDSQSLYRACESAQPGVLVHPTRGTHLVACRSVKVSDKLEDGEGETTAELEFVEANPVGTGLGSSVFGIIISAVLSVSSDSFRTNYTPAQVSQPWSSDIVVSAQSLVKMTHSALVQTFTTETSSSQWRVALKMEEVANDPGLAMSADLVDKAFTSGINELVYNIQDLEEQWKVLRRLTNAAAIESTFPISGAAEVENSLYSRFRVLTGVALAETAMSRKYSNAQATIAAMDTASAVLEDEAKSAYNICDNALYLELQKYIVSFKKMMYDLTYRLPSLITVDFAGGVHPLVAAYVLYNDAKKHRDLEPRNIIDANGRFDRYVRGIAPT